MGELGLVARDEELAHIVRALGADAGGVVIAGAAGVGKSRLLAEVLRAATERGHPCERVTATGAASSIPFAPVAHLLDQPTPSPHDQGTAGLMARVARVLAGRGRRRFVLGVDDAHLLDDHTAALVLHLVRTRSAFVVASVRAEAAAPDAVTALWKDAFVDRLELQPLSTSDVTALAQEFFGGPVDGALCRWLAATSAGNPLYACELLRSGLEGGSFASVDGIWRALAPFVPNARLVELVEARLGRLEPAAREAVEVVAVVEEISLAVLDEIAGPDGVAAAERAGLLVIDGSTVPAVRLSHPVHGEVARRRIGVAEARRIRRRVAAGLEARPISRSDMLRVAVWKMDGGLEVSPEQLEEAAWHAVHVLFDYPLAERLASAAVAATGGRWTASVLLAESLAEQNRYAEAEAVLGALGGPPPSVEAAYAYLDVARRVLWWGLGRVDETFGLLDAAEAWFVEDEWRGVVTAARVEALAASGRCEAAIRIGEPLMAAAALPLVVARVAPPLAKALSFSGRSSDALAVCESAMPAALEIAAGSPRAPAEIIAEQVVALLSAGRVADLEALITPYYESAAEHHDDNTRGAVAFALGRAALLRGRAEAAASWLRESIPALESTDSRAYLPSTFALLACALAVTEDLDEAKTWAARARDLLLPGNESAILDILSAELWIAAAAGDAAWSERVITQAAGELSLQPAPLALLLHDGLRVGCGTAEAAATIVRTGERAQSELLRACAVHARAITSDDRAGFEGAAEAFEALGLWLAAAECFAEAAVASARSGQARVAARLRTRGLQLRERCGRVMTPGLMLLGEGAPALTAREREVAAMAARGAANAIIAEELGISVRTVEVHLQRAYGKLGVHGREALAEALGQHRT